VVTQFIVLLLGGLGVAYGLDRCSSPGYFRSKEENTEMRCDAAAGRPRRRVRP